MKISKKEVKVIQLSSPKQVKEPLPRLGVDFEVGVLLEVVFDRTKKVFCSKSRSGGFGNNLVFEPGCFDLIIEEKDQRKVQKSPLPK